ncbi:MAG: CopG family transcriptional regulator [Desulfobacteraceae bacterium]|nr:MAG: CopG family transcriptional regulator [Desulfobacteraceae bacterium]
MGQVTIYLNPETEKKMINSVKKSGLSKSRWLAELIKEKTADTWPDSVSKLSGAWKDFPGPEEIRKDLGKDAKREPL